MSVADFEIKYNGKDFIDEIERRAVVAIEAAGIKAEGYAKLELENPPRRIDTGRLRDSITHTTENKPGEHTAFIGTNVEYGPYVFYGTTRMAPNRFLKNAIERNKAEYKSLIERYLGN